MRISRRSLPVLVLVASLIGAPLAMTGTAFATSEDPAVEAVYKDGLMAYRSHDYERGLHALRYAADNGHFLARYYLAGILSDNDSDFTDHHAAFQLYKALAEIDVDPDAQYDWRAVFMPKALLQYARYLSSGLPADELHPEAVPADPDAARDQIIRAAQVYGDPDAQFELAKLELDDPDTARAGLDLMATLAERRGHAAALAFIAELWLTGKHGYTPNPALAFAYMTLAVENAPEQDRIWIEQEYSQMYCTIPAVERATAPAYVDEIRQMNDEASIARLEAPPAADALGNVLDASGRGLILRCANGEQVAMPGSDNSAPVGSDPDGGTDGIMPVGNEAEDGASVGPEQSGTIEANGGSTIKPASGPAQGVSTLGNMMGLGVKGGEAPALTGQTQSLGD